ncbi:MAG: amidohydrolase [Gammaproteobacteria bacterium]|nr:amidohydrolase [Gammaproteobacteria bacterium]MDH3413702.1 amidohydrolase [Gammaproteobacteria bacterium]
MMRTAAGFLLLFAVAALPAAELPIFDAHIHYSHTVWDTVSPRDAVALLREAGVRRALVSSSDDDGTQRLLAEAPDLVIPELRPYPTAEDMATWVSDERIVGYVEARLKRYRYVAIGEFHLYGADAERPVVRRLVELAHRYGLFLHAHSDADAIERLFRHNPQARILWAHAGFDRPEAVREMLRRHPNLWCELAFRTDHAPGGRLDPRWRSLFLEFPDRFLIGSDTYIAERWNYVVVHARWSRGWLAQLPGEVAERIAYRNGEELFGKMVTRNR